MQYLSSLVSFRKNLIDCYRKGISKEVVDAMRRPGQQHSRRCRDLLLRNRFLPGLALPPPNRIYCQLVITEVSMTPDHITVVLVDEILGY